MGFVSYFEDIIDRYADDLLRTKAYVKEHAAAGGVLSSEHACGVLRLLGDAEAILRDLRNHLDVATDPTIDLAAQVLVLERENLKVRQELTQLAPLHRQLKKLEGVLATAKEALKQEKRRNNALQRKLENALRSDPEAVYDAFTSEERIRRLKPNQ